MKVNSTSVVLALALVGAGAFAFLHDSFEERSTGEAAANAARFVPPPAVDEAERSDQALPANHPPIGTAGPLPPGATLPPNHPPIGGGSSPTAAMDSPAQGEEVHESISWKVPATWASAPNPSTMRIATHKVPHAAKDAEDAELSISRAGGDVEANIQRWVTQFEGAAAPVRREKTVHGMKISIVEVEGTYGGGMGPASGSHTGWALLGAIVATSTQPYFFKLTGPVATVKSAHDGFESLLASIAPALP